MTGLAAVDWDVAAAPVPYTDAIARMEQRVAAIEAGTARELVWLLEHPPVYTAGTSADEIELLDAGGIPVIATGRGGRYTYHGPGQRVVYVLCDLRQRGRDLRGYIQKLENWAIAALADLGIRGEIRQGRIGIWVVDGTGGEAKIGAIGVRVRRWIAYHGLAVNVQPDLAAFQGIVPCGIAEHGVTSLQALGNSAGMVELDAALHRHAAIVFGNPKQLK